MTIQIKWPGALTPGDSKNTHQLSPGTLLSLAASFNQGPFLKECPYCAGRLYGSGIVNCRGCGNPVNTIAASTAGSANFGHGGCDVSGRKLLKARPRRTRPTPAAGPQTVTEFPTRRVGSPIRGDAHGAA